MKSTRIILGEGKKTSNSHGIELLYFIRSFKLSVNIKKTMVLQSHVLKIFSSKH
jgi:hypothetical protein